MWHLPQGSAYFCSHWSSEGYSYTCTPLRVFMVCSTVNFTFTSVIIIIIIIIIIQLIEMYVCI
jgi:hypothetical protein